MSWIHLDAWGQRENETPPEPEETETQTVEVNLTIEYDPEKHDHPDEWIWEDLLDVGYVKARIVNET